MTGSAIVVQGNASSLPLPDESVDLIVTSPPYFAMRSYTDGGAHFNGQVGSEPTPQEFLEALWTATAEMMRVLKPTGSIFVNLGDKYAGSGSHNNSNIAKTNRGSHATYNKSTHLDRIGFQGVPGRTAKVTGIRTKSLLGLPWRYAIGCIDRLDLILRAELVWSKPNGLPESVNDRVRRSHEQWFHFVKEPRYYTAVDEIRLPHEDPLRTETHKERAGKAMREGTPLNGTGMRPHTFALEQANHPLGKLPPSVWTISSEPLLVPQWAKDKYNLPDHFAAFPQEWPRRLITGWAPPAICLSCGEGRRPVAVGYACACTPFTEHPGSGRSSPTSNGNGKQGDRPVDIGATHERVGPWREYHFDQWDAPETRPTIVLDPFGGTGTVAMVAKTLDRIGISVDLSHDYCELARWRIHESGHGAKSMRRTWSERQESML